jgi:hypothetical protein
MQTKNRRAHYGAPFAFSVPQSVTALVCGHFRNIPVGRKSIARYACDVPRDEAEIASLACAISRNSIREACPTRSTRSSVVVRVTIVFTLLRRRPRAGCWRVAGACRFFVAAHATASCDVVSKNRSFATERVFAGIFLRSRFLSALVPHVSCELSIGRMDVHTSFDPSACEHVEGERLLRGGPDRVRALQNRVPLTC